MCISLCITCGQTICDPARREVPARKSPPCRVRRQGGRRGSAGKIQDKIKRSEFFSADEIIKRHVKDVRKQDKICKRRIRFAAFVCLIGLVRDPHFFGDGFLADACRNAEPA